MPCDQPVKMREAGLDIGLTRMYPGFPRYGFIWLASSHLSSPLLVVAVVAAGQITTFHTITVLLCEIVLGSSVTVEAHHDRV